MFSYLSILNPGFTTVSNPNPLQVGTLAYVSFLNPPGTGGGGAGTGFTGTNATGTLNSAGLAISVATPGGGAAQTFSAGTSSGSANPVVFSNSNGIGFGFNGSTITASHNGLTTAAQVSHSHALATTTTNGASIVVGTSGSAGYTLGVPAYLTTAGATNAITTAAQVSHSHAFATTTTNGSNVIVATSGSAGVTIAVPPFITTAAGGAGIGGIVYSNATQTSGTLYLSGSNGITIRSGANTAIIEFDGHHLDAVIPSGNGFGTGFSSITSGTVGFVAGSNVSFSQNGNNLTIQAATNALTTAAQVSHSHAFATTTTNGSLIVVATSGSAGVTMAVPPYLTAAAGGGGVAVAGSGASTVTSGTLQFSNLNGISFGLNGSTMTASYSSNHSHGNPTLALTNLSGTTASNSAGLTLSLAAAAPGGGAAVNGYWAVPPWGYGSQSNALLTNITGISRRFIFMPFQVANNLSFGEFHWPMSRASAGSNGFSMYMGIYSHVNYSSIQTIWNTSVAYSNTATASVSGLRGFEATFASTSLSPGQYVLGLMFDPIGASTSAMNYSLMGMATGNSMLQTQVVNGTNTYHNNVNHMWLPFHGRYSATSAAVPANVVSGDMLAQGNASAVPLPMYWVLGTHY